MSLIIRVINDSYLVRELVTVPKVSDKHREERIGVIFQAAEQVFREKGYQAATIQDVIERSGVSRGGIYTYFPNMEQLFLALLQAQDERSRAAMAEAVRQGDRAWPVLELLIRRTAEGIAGVSGSMAPAIYEYFFTEGWRNKEHLPLLERRVAATVDALTALMRRGMAGGEFRADADPDLIARTLVSTFDGLMLAVLHFGAEAARLKEQTAFIIGYIHAALTSGGEEAPDA